MKLRFLYTHLGSCASRSSDISALIKTFPYIILLRKKLQRGYKCSSTARPQLLRLQKKILANTVKL